MDTMEILKTTLSKKFNLEDFTEKNLLFLEKYTVTRESTKPNDILKDIGEFYKGKPVGEQEYYRIYPTVKSAKKYINYIYSRQPKRIKNSFGNNFLIFLKWWNDCLDIEGNIECYYCGVKDSIVKAVFDCQGITSKKFHATMQIDRRDPDAGYNAENCVFACPLCNNAKSDMISDTEFKTYFGEAINKYWEYKAKEANSTV